MAPLPVISNCYRVALEWTDSGRPGATASNVIHINKSGSNPAAIATLLDSSATVNMWHCQGSHASVTTIHVTPLDGSGVTFPYTPATPAHWTGSQTTNTPVPQVANIVKLLTTQRGRSFRGRVFLPWTDEGAINNNALDTGNASSVSTAWIAFQAALVAASATMAVASYKLAVSTPVAALASELDTATQRRRLVRTAVTT